MSVAGATLFSFAVALLHFALELVFFQTMTLLSALQPMVVAGEQAHPDLYLAHPDLYLADHCSHLGFELSSNVWLA